MSTHPICSARTRLATLVVLAGALGALSARGDEPEYQHVELVPGTQNPDGVGGIESSTGKQVPADRIGDIVLVPFDIPKPEETDKTSDVYRTLDKLYELIQVKSDPKVINPGILTPSQLAFDGKDLFGTRIDGKEGKKLFLVEVSSATGLPGVEADQRPDSNSKGVAFVLSGIHAREWMAFEAVVRRLEQFNNGDFLKRLIATRGLKKAGDRNVFFVENVHAFLLCLDNPEAIDMTHREFNACYKITKNTDPTLQLSTLFPGELRKGRMQYKNLRSMEELGLKREEPTKKDPTALLGVLSDENAWRTFFPAGDVGLSPIVTTPKSDGYRGAVAGTTDKDGNNPGFRSESEAKAMVAAATKAFGAEGTVSTHLTGVAFLDVHTPFGAIVMTKIGDLDDFDRLQMALIDAAKPAPLTIMNEERGNQVDIRKSFGIVGATLELPPSPQVLALPALAYPSTNFYLQNVVQAGGEYTRQKEIAQRVIDATLDRAAGPPYVRQVIVVKEKPKGLADAYDASKLGARAEVVYWKQWEKKETDRTRALTDMLETYGGGKREINARKWDGTQVPVGGEVVYRVVVSFSKPMRKDAKDVAAPSVKLEQLLKPGEKSFELKTLTAPPPTPPAPPPKELAATKEWIHEADSKDLTTNVLFKQTGAILKLGALRYDFDTFTFTIPFKVGGDGATVIDGDLFMDTIDQVRFALDGNAETVVLWDQGVRGWVAYEDAAVPPAKGSKGGTDRSHRLQFDTLPPTLKFK